MDVILSAVSCIVPDYHNVWTDGSLVLDKVAGISSSGAGFFADHAASFWDLLIRLLVFPPLVLGSLLTSLTTAGVLVPGAG